MHFSTCITSLKGSDINTSACQGKPTSRRHPCCLQGIGSTQRQRQQQFKGEIIDLLEGVALAIKGRLDDVELSVQRWVLHAYSMPASCRRIQHGCTLHVE